MTGAVVVGANCQRTVEVAMIAYWYDAHLLALIGEKTLYHANTLACRRGGGGFSINLRSAVQGGAGNDVLVGGAGNDDHYGDV